jgi:hypothetical protein
LLRPPDFVPAKDAECTKANNNGVQALGQIGFNRGEGWGRWETEPVLLSFYKNQIKMLYILHSMCELKWLYSLSFFCPVC